MAMKTIIVLFTILSIWVIGNVDSATPHHAPAPAVDCGSLVLNLADCLSFVMNGSTVNKPEGTCCSGLKTVLKTDAQCLCEGFKNSAQLGVTLNITKALSLPTACRVSAPPFSNCGLSVAPGAAPAISPSVALPPSTVAGAPSAVPGLNEVSPVPAPASSGSSALAITMRSVLLAVIVSSFSFF